MMPEIKNVKIRVIFTEKSDQILADIEKKYNLQESGDELSKKIQTGKFSKSTMLVRLTSSFVKGEISEKDLIASIQKETAVPLQTAEQITKDIIANLAPTLKKMSEQEIAELNQRETPPAEINKIMESGLVREIKAPIGVEEILNSKAKANPIAAMPTPRPPAPKIRPARPEKKLPEKKAEPSQPAQEKSSGPDAYREPIE